MAVPQRIDEKFNQRYQAVGAAANDSNHVRDVAQTGQLPVGTAANDHSLSEIRRKSPDRSDLGVGIRNVRTESRTSSMPGHPSNQPDNPYKTTHQTFIDESNRRTIQPTSTLNASEKPAKKQESGVRKAEIEYSKQPIKKPPSGLNKVLVGAVSIVANSMARLRATTTNIRLWWIGMYTWAFFQLPMVILSLIFFASALALDKFWEVLTTAEEDDWAITKFFKGVFKWGGERVSDGNALLKEYVGFDFTLISPSNMMFLTHSVVFAYAIFLLLLMFLMYKISRLNPLLGDGGGIKMGLFLLAIVGYSIPAINMLPWFLPWTMAVWMYPK